MSAPQQTPYIGSKISLISKSEIRYEGILYTVDTKESTIALAKVRSFGTEDRPTETPVLGRDEIYEYIIFKASDIKDLMVCETPKPVPQLCPGLPYDPAILSVSQPAARSQSGTVNKPIITSGSSSRSATPMQRTHSPTTDTGVQTTGSGRAPGAGRARPSSRGIGGVAHPPPPPPHHEHYQEHAGHARRGGFQGQPMHAGFQGPGAVFRGALGARTSAPPPPRFQQQFQQGGGNYRNAVIGGSGFSSARRVSPVMGGFGGGGGGRGASFVGQRQQTPRGTGAVRGRAGSSAVQPLKFDSDYDFEKANEQFQETLNHLKDELTTKLKITEGGDAEAVESSEAATAAESPVAELEPGELADEDEAVAEIDHEFYDKTRSFFDKISCEALERQEGKSGRQDWRKERVTNTETFGQAAVRHFNYRRGPRGGFYGPAARGNSFYRGGGGGFRGGRGSRNFGYGYSRPFYQQY